MDDWANHLGQLWSKIKDSYPNTKHVFQHSLKILQNIAQWYDTKKKHKIYKQSQWTVKRRPLAKTLKHFKTWFLDDIRLGQTGGLLVFEHHLIGFAQGTPWNEQFDEGKHQWMDQPLISGARFRKKQSALMTPTKSGLCIPRCFQSGSHQLRIDWFRRIKIQGKSKRIPYACMIIHVLYV